jgi:MFS family permease
MPRKKSRASTRDPGSRSSNVVLAGYLIACTQKRQSICVFPRGRRHLRLVGRVLANPSGSENLSGRTRLRGVFAHDGIHSILRGLLGCAIWAIRRFPYGRSGRGNGIGACLPQQILSGFGRGFRSVGVGLANCVPLIFSAAARRSQESFGRGIAAVASAGYLGLFVGPPIVGSIAQGIGLRNALPLVAAMLVFTLLLARTGLRVPRKSPHTEPGETAGAAAAD